MTHPNEQLLIEEVLKPLLQPLESAVKRGKWDGLDGAKQWVHGPRITVLPTLYNAKVQKAVLVRCFEHMAKIAEGAHEGSVIKEFATANPNVIINCAESNPEIFKNYPSVFKYCLSSLKPSQQKKLLDLVQISR